MSLWRVGDDGLVIVDVQVLSALSVIICSAQSGRWAFFDAGMPGARDDSWPPGPEPACADCKAMADRVAGEIIAAGAGHRPGRPEGNDIKLSGDRHQPEDD